MLVELQKISKTQKVSKTSPQNNSETNEKEILRERYTSPELRHKTIYDLRLKTIIWSYKNNMIMEYQKIMNLLDDATNHPSKLRTRNNRSK